MTSACQCTLPAIDATLTVNEVLARCPAALPLLNAFGVDTCCGGEDSLRDAARRAGIPLPVLLAAVEHAAAGGAR